MQNSKASKMFDSQPLGCVICSNHIDYNLITLIFKRDVLINFDSPCPHCGDPSPPHVGTSLMDAPFVDKISADDDANNLLHGEIYFFSLLNL